MNKFFAVFKREYLQAVRRKMFIIMTFLMPVLMAAMIIIPGILMERGMGRKAIVVIDGTGQLAAAFKTPEATEQDLSLGGGARNIPNKVDIEYIDAKGQNLDEAAKAPLARLTQEQKENRLDGVFIVPTDAMSSSDARMKYYSRSATDFITQSRLASTVNEEVQRNRLIGRGINPDELEKLMARLRVDAVQLSKSGEEKKGGAANFLGGFILTALLFIPSFVYGLEIMRGIIQEKTDRVVEVLVSSMSPSQLLIGKILGVAAVGLTQIAAWIAMGAVVAALAAGSAVLAGEGDLLALVRPATFIYFAIFFLLAYLTYVCIYAIGGAVCNNEREAQQLIMPVTMVMMLPWFLMAGIITNPESALSVGFSLSPVFGPMTMYVRTLVADPPMWHVALSILVSIATIAVFFWVTAKIFRVGILSYGKRPTIPELWRWVKVA